MSYNGDGVVGTHVHEQGLVFLLIGPNVDHTLLWRKQVREESWTIIINYIFKFRDECHVILKR